MDYKPVMQFFDELNKFMEEEDLITLSPESNTMVYGLCGTIALYKHIATKIPIMECHSHVLTSLRDLMEEDDGCRCASCTIIRKSLAHTEFRDMARRTLAEIEIVNRFGKKGMVN